MKLFKKQPNQETIDAMEELESGGGTITGATLDAIIFDEEPKLPTPVLKEGSNQIISYSTEPTIALYSDCLNHVVNAHRYAWTINDADPLAPALALLIGSGGQTTTITSDSFVSPPKHSEAEGELELVDAYLNSCLSILFPQLAKPYYQESIAYKFEVLEAAIQELFYNRNETKEGDK